jgi:hypothetical protein
MNYAMRNCFFALAALLALYAGSTGLARAQEPVIAPEIGQIINSDGVDAANARFAELIQSPSLDYNMESQGLMTLMTGYIQSGNEEAASAVGEMYAQMMQQMLSGGASAYPPGMAEAMAEAQKAEEAQQRADQAAAEAEQQMQQQQAAQSRGKSRDDLDRFKGMYSDPGSDDTGRSIFVTVSCDGYLVTGAMWGDVSPWWMRSAADKVFTYADSWTNISMEFVGDGGPGTLMQHDIEGVASPLENKGPLPDDWPECMERPIR